VSVEAGLNRSSETQAYYQLAALAVTLGIALVGGAVTGNFHEHIAIAQRVQEQCKLN